LAKKEDKRTHEQKIRDLKVAFENAKIRAIAVGKVNECTVRKICEEAKVNRVYLQTNKLSDQEINDQYHAVNEDIVKWRKEFSLHIEEEGNQSAIAKEIKLKEQYESERDEAHKQCLILSRDLTHYKKLIEDKNNQLKRADERVLDATYESSQNASHLSIAYTEVKVICPDDILKIDGQYDFQNKALRDTAWQKCRENFKSLINRPPLPIRVYLLIGPPCSGKTYWRKQTSNFKHDRLPVVIDATNATTIERSRWFSLIFSSNNRNNIVTCAVYFITPMTLLNERNGSRPIDKRLSEADLFEMYNKVEEVDITGELFDEIQIIRA